MRLFFENRITYVSCSSDRTGESRDFCCVGDIRRRCFFPLDDFKTCSRSKRKFSIAKNISNKIKRNLFSVFLFCLPSSSSGNLVVPSINNCFISVCLRVFVFKLSTSF